MAALSGARNTIQYSDHPWFDWHLDPGVAASTTCYQGGIACLNSSGYAVPGSASTTLTCIGMFGKTVTNSGSAGAATVTVRQGIFKWGNSASGDLITIADVGKDVYIVDDQTVAKTDGTGARSIAGKCVGVESDGVWVLMGIR